MSVMSEVVQMYSIVPEDVYNGGKTRKTAGHRTEGEEVAGVLVPLRMVFDVEEEERGGVVLLHLPAWHADGHGIMATAELDLGFGHGG